MASDLFASFSLYAAFPMIVDSKHSASNDDLPDGDPAGPRDVKAAIVPILESVEDNSTLPTDQPVG